MNTQSRKKAKKPKSFSEIMNSVHGQVNSMFKGTKTVRGYLNYGR